MVTAAPPAYRPEDDVVTIGRAEFIRDYFDNHDGDSITILGPYGCGKTQLGLELLDAITTPDRQGFIFVMKPRDATIAAFMRRTKTPVTRDYPPSQAGGAIGRLFRKKPRMWVLWPTESGDPDADDIRHRNIFRRALRMLYNAAGRRGRRRQVCIIFVDETMSLQEEMQLKRDLRRIWSKGRSVGCGLMAASQRPVLIDRLAFQAQHLFLANDPDRDMQRRYVEIGGGVNPEVVKAVLARLRRFQWLYIDRDNRTMCIVDAS